MQELLEKARQEDQEKDDLFVEEADDDEFQEPGESRVGICGGSHAD